MSATKIDSVVSDLIDAIRKGNKGFVLGLANGGGDTKITVQESLPPVDEYIPPARLRSHTLLDTKSFTAFATRYGTKEKSIVLYDEQKVTLTIDEQIAVGDRETITMPFERSSDWLAWSAIIGKPQTHKAMMKFLLGNTHNLSDISLLDAMRVFKTSTTVVQDSDISDDGRSVSFLVKQTSGEEKAKFPKVITVKLPILAQDVEDKASWLSADLRLEIELPNEPKDPPTFTLCSSQWSQFFVNRVDHEGNTIRNSLTGFIVIRGRHATVDRRMGRNAR